MPITSLNSIKQSLYKYRGRKIQLSTCGGRRKSTVAKGVLEGVYPDVFTVLVKEDNYVRRFCYTYSEILTNNVSIKIYSRKASK